MTLRPLLRSTCGLVLAAYPSTWRARYGAELEDVLDEHQIRVSTVLDLVVGALDAHRHPELGFTEIAPSSARLRSTFVSLLIASVVFALAWTAVVSVRLRSVIGHGTDLQNHGDVDRAISFVQVSGAISLIVILVCTVLVASATMRRRQHRGELSLPLGVGFVALAAFVGLARMAGTGMENQAEGGQLLRLAVLAWAAGAACLLPMIGSEIRDPALLGRSLRVGQLGVIGLGVTVAGSVWLAVVVALDAPSLGAEVLPTIVMALTAAWAAIALRRVGRAQRRVQPSGPLRGS